VSKGRQWERRGNDRRPRAPHACTRLLCDLVHHHHVSDRGGVVDGELDTLAGVADVEEAARLGAVAVDGQWMADSSLDDEAVERRAKDAVVIVPGRRAVVETRVRVSRAQGRDPAMIIGCRSRTCTAQESSEPRAR